MDLQTMTYLVVGASFALYIGIAIWARAGSTSEFYVAGGGVHPITNGMATAADWMSAASFISMAGLIANMGYGGGLFLMGWTGGYVLLACLLAPYLRKFGKFTVPDFIGERYYSKAARLVAVVCVIFISFTYVAGQMRGVGIVFSRYLEVSIETGVVIGMAIVFFYSVLGGMKGITYTQVAQYCVMIFAYMVPAIYVSMMITGNPIPQLGFGSEVSGTGQSVVERLNGLGAELGFTAKSVVVSPEMRGKGRWLAIPPALYQPIEQAMIVTRHGAASQPEASRRFAEFMRGPQARRILEAHGYLVP